MKDKFADLEKRNAFSTLVPLAAVLAILGMFLAYHWSGSPAVKLAGLVESSGPVTLGKLAGGTREVARIRLMSGEVVPAYVVSGGPLSPGDNVTVLMEHRLIGAPAYQVVSKDTSHTP